MADPRFKEVTVDDINATYRNGLITAAQKNDLLRRKAAVTLEETMGEKGFFGSILERTIKNAQDGWDNVVEAAQNDPTKSSWQNIKAIGQASWGQIQILTSLFNAIGEVSGAKAEQMALGAGASPGLAKVINIAVDVGTGFIPIAGAARSGVKGVQKIGKAVAARGAKKVAQEGAEEAAKLAAKQADDVVRTAVTEGLKADGVQGLERFVTEQVDEAGKIIQTAAKSADDAAEIIPQAMNRIADQTDFQKSYDKFLREMKKVTETKAHEVTLAQAEKLGIGLDDLKNIIPGQALDERQMAAYLKALDEPVDNLAKLAKDTLAGVDGAPELFAKQMANFMEYAPKFRGAEVTAGRSVEILKESPPMKAITDMLVGWDPENIAKGDMQAAIRTMAEDVAALADEPGKLKALQVQTKSLWGRISGDWWPMARSVYTNILLARPITQVRNFVGNSVAIATHNAERELAGWLSIDAAKGVKTGEGWYAFHGQMAALGDGIKAWGEAFKKLDPNDATKLDFIPARLPGPLGRVLSSPGDNLIGMDRFFKELSRQGDHYAMALRKGSEQGLTGKALADYVARRRLMPTQDMLKHAEDAALSATFQQELGTFGKKAQSFLQTGPLALWFPFMKTPMNLIKWGWNRTPGLQFMSRSLYGDILAGGERADMAIARLTLSNMVGMFVYGLAQEGILTGGGPVDKGLRRSWLGTKQPYSIMGKDGWIPISNAAEPGTTSIELVADFAEIVNQLDDPTAEQGMMAGVLSISRDILDNTWWRTMGDLVDLVGSLRTGEGVGQQAMRVAAAPLINVTSGGPLGAAITRAQDPIRREARGLMDEWRARVPGYSSELPPMRDAYGDPILPPQALGGPWVGIASPLVTKGFEDDEIKKEGARLQVKIPQFPWSFGGTNRDDFDVRAPMPGERLPVDLTPQQRDRWQVIHKNILRHPELGIGPTILERDEYKNGTYALQREMFMDYMAQARSAAKDALLTEDVELGKKALSAQAERYLPMLQGEQREEAQGQIAESLDLLDTLLPEQRENLNKWGFMGPEATE